MSSHSIRSIKKERHPEFPHWPLFVEIVAHHQALPGRKTERRQDLLVISDARLARVHITGVSDETELGVSSRDPTQAQKDDRTLPDGIRREDQVESFLRPIKKLTRSRDRAEKPTGPLKARGHRRHEDRFAFSATLTEKRLELREHAVDVQACISTRRILQCLPQARQNAERENRGPAVTKHSHPKYGDKARAQEPGMSADQRSVKIEQQGAAGVGTWHRG